MANSKALVVLSGGQDSTTCLFWALSESEKSHLLRYAHPSESSLTSKSTPAPRDSQALHLGASHSRLSPRWSEIKTVTFDYGQKHKIELESARKICELANVEFDLVTIPQVLRSTSPLVDASEELDQYSSISDFKPGLQATFVPGRNILFLTIAANIAMHHGIRDIIIGVCEEDFGGYYDCRQAFIDPMQKALSQGLLGQDEGITIHTPLMKLNKAETVKLAVNLPQPWSAKCLQALSLSHTCYAGTNPPCGHCHACLLRERGFKEAGVEDPLKHLIV